MSGDRQSAGNEGAPRTRIALMGLIEAPSPSLVTPRYCLTRHVTAGDATRERADQADADAAAAANCTLVYIAYIVYATFVIIGRSGFM